MWAASLIMAALVTAVLLCDNRTHRLALNNASQTNADEQALQWAKRTTTHAESRACFGLLVGASTAIGEAYAWHYLNGLLPQLYGAETRNMGFWDNSKGRYKGCSLGDYLVLQISRQEFQTGMSSSSSSLCSSTQLTASSFARNLVRSHNCQESQGQQQLLSASLDDDVAKTFGRQVTAVQPSSNRSSRSPGATLDRTYLQDFSSTYLFSAVAPHRIQLQLPEARILVILTEPVTHVITQFNRLWFQQHNRPRAPSGNVLALDEEQRQSWVNALTEVITQQMHHYTACQAGRRVQPSNMAVSQCSKSFSHPGKTQHQPEWQLVQQAVFADSLARWLRLFPSEQVLIWTSEGFAAQPEEHIQQLTAWLGLSRSSIHPAALTQRQAKLQLELDGLVRIAPEPPEHLLDAMQQFYESHNHRLLRLLENKGFSDTAAQMRRLWAPRQHWNTHSTHHPPTPPSSADPEPKQPSCQVVTDISPDQVLLQIPQSFLGISHEWPHVASINSIPGYKNLLRFLSSFGSGPLIIRVGGGSTDKQDMVPSAAVFDALRQVHEDTGVQYMLGLNFQKGDVELARAQWESARQHLPADAVLTFEIGNEPNFYEGMKGGKTALEYVRCCLVNDWSHFAHQLSCPCGHQHCCSQRLFAGPAWGHINVFSSTIKWFLEASHNYVNLTTIHWYKATKGVHNSPVTLLDEAPVRKEMANLKKLVGISNSFNKPLRIAEMNSISNSGRNGVSNVFAAALWTLDALFEVAAAGAVGVNLHQGAGQNYYTALLRTYHKQNETLAPVSLRPPFYGMVMFQQAVRSGSYMLTHNTISPSNTTLNCQMKIWPLLDASNGHMRLVIVNKHATNAGLQFTCVSSEWANTYAASAKILRLHAKGADPLSAASGISLGGYVFGYGGQLQGREQAEWTTRKVRQGSHCWEVYMPAASAALLDISNLVPT